jgi:Iron-containing redox enzyme
VPAAELVRATASLTFPAVRAAAYSLWTAPDVRERYPVYLAAMHGLIVASVPLMEAASARCGSLPGGDRSARALTAYLTDHIAEERGHDGWLLDDLAALGCTEPDALLGHARKEEIAALAGAQYYLINHCHPACLLGYIAVLEGCPPHAAAVAGLAASTGLPARAFTTLARHAEVDPGHQADLHSLLGALPLSTAVAAMVARNTAYTAVTAAALLQRLAGQEGPR